MDIRLMFWVEGELISKFLCPIIPQVGQVWDVPKGEHKLREVGQGREVVKVLLVEIHPYPSIIDVSIKAEYTTRFEPFRDLVKLSPGGFEK